MLTSLDENRKKLEETHKQITQQKALAEVGPAPDLWGPWESLKDTPTLLLRGAISDLLSPEIVEKMRKVYPDFDYAEVPNVGHAPTLSEPAAWDAIEAFLEKAG